MEKLGGRFTSFSRFWWRDQSKILSFLNAKNRGEVGGILVLAHAKNLKSKMKSFGNAKIRGEDCEFLQILVDGSEQNTEFLQCKN